LGGCPEGPRSLGRLDIPQEGNLKGAGTGHPYVLKDKQRGRRPACLNRELWLELGKKREFMTFGRKDRELKRIIRIS